MILQQQQQNLFLKSVLNDDGTASLFLRDQQVGGFAGVLKRITPIKMITSNGQDFPMLEITLQDENRNDVTISRGWGSYAASNIINDLLGLETLENIVICVYPYAAFNKAKNEAYASFSFKYAEGWDAVGQGLIQPFKGKYAIQKGGDPELNKVAPITFTEDEFGKKVPDTKIRKAYWINQAKMLSAKLAEATNGDGFTNDLPSPSQEHTSVESGGESDGLPF